MPGSTPGGTPAATLNTYPQGWRAALFPPAVPARVVAGGTKYPSDTGIRRSCAATRGADIAARCPYHAKHVRKRERVRVRVRLECRDTAKVFWRGRIRAASRVWRSLQAASGDC